MPDRNIWNEFKKLGPPREVFAALNEVVGGNRTGNFDRVKIGPWGPKKVNFVTRFSNKGNAMIEVDNGLETTEIKNLVSECQKLLTGGDAWFSIPLEVNARVEGAFDHPDMRVRPVPDLDNWTLLSVSPPFWNVELPHQPLVYPLFIDVRYRTASSSFIDSMRRDRAAREAKGLAALGLWPMPRNVPTSSRASWSIVWDENRSKTLSARLHRGFYHPDLGINPVLTPLSSAHPNLPSIKHSQFVDGPLGLEPPGRLWASEMFGAMLDARNTMDFETREKLARSLHWFTEAVSSDSYTLQVVTFASAIECLLTKTDPETCSSCGQEVFGVHKNFKSFIDKFASTKESEEYLSLVYSARSKLVHGENVYEVDEPVFSIMNRSGRDAIVTMSVTRRAVINWLLSDKTAASAS